MRLLWLPSQRDLSRFGSAIASLFPVEMNSFSLTRPSGKYPFPLANQWFEAFTALAFVASATSTIKVRANERAWSPI